jgi:outer membrane biosynthesis protein TonB
MLTASPRAGRTPADDNRCRHLTLGGARCTMPTLYGKDLCYQHGHRDKVLRVKPAVTDNFPLAPIVTFAYMEDHDSVLANINAIADAFSRHAIDFRQVTALTYLMQTALKTLAQMAQIETKITAEEIVRDVVYDDLNQPLAVPDPEPAPTPESQPEAELQPEPEPQPEPITVGCHPEEQSDEGSAVACPSVPGDEATDSVAVASTPQPTQIQTLKASIAANPSISHTYKNQKKQPSSFQTHAETRGRG